VPELPELEVLKARLRLALAGRVITDALLLRPQCLRAPRSELDSLKGAHLLGVTRHGRFLSFDTDRRLHLCLLLARSGRLELVPSARPAAPGLIFILRLAEQDVRLADNSAGEHVQVHLVADPKKIPWIAELGLDPQSPDFTLARFRRTLQRHRRPVRKLLTDPRAVPGIGSRCADEILFTARLSPLALTSELKPEAVIRLYTSTKKVLADAIVGLKSGGPDAAPATMVHGRLGQSCLACGAQVRRVRRDGFSMHYCPDCQTGGEILADDTPPPKPS